MTAIKDMDISPTPWRVRHEDGCDWSEVRDANNNFVTDGGENGFCGVADGPLIAAAPELYEELRKELERRHCVTCPHGVWSRLDGITMLTGCDGGGRCPKPDWKRAIDKANGVKVE